MLLVYHGLYCGTQPDCCVPPGLVSMFLMSWVVAGVQALRSPADQPFGLEVDSRGHRTVSQQVCLR